MLIIGIIISLITAVLVSYRSLHIYYLWPQGRADSAGVAFIFRKVPHPCPRTLLKTPISYKVKEATGGSFCYIGLQTALKNHANLISDCIPNSELTLPVNIDGIPLFKSSNTQLCPILGTIKEIVYCSSFVIAFYSGPHKPSSLKEYLSNIVEDMKEVA